MVALLRAVRVAVGRGEEEEAGGKKDKTPRHEVEGQGRRRRTPTPETDEASSDEKSSEQPDADDERRQAEGGAAARRRRRRRGGRQEARQAGQGARTAEAEGAGGGPIALRFGIGGQALFRTLTLDRRQGRAGAVLAVARPEAAVWLEAYPAAFATDGFAANIGLFGRFNYGFGAVVEDAGRARC